MTHSRMRRMLASRREAGQCIRCDQPRAPQSKCHCPYHMIQAREEWRAKHNPEARRDTGRGSYRWRIAE
jgi:hypothetical protein